MLEPPFITVDQGGDVYIYRSAKDIALDLEIVDVENGEYRIFDSRGAIVELCVDEILVASRPWFLGGSRWRKSLSLQESARASAPEELARILKRMLDYQPEPLAEKPEGLKDLIGVATEVLGTLPEPKEGPGDPEKTAALGASDGLARAGGEGGRVVTSYVLVFAGGALAGFLLVLIYGWLSLRLFEQASGANESTELMLGAARHVIGIAVAGALTVGWLLLLVEAAGIKPGTGLSVAGHSGLVIGILIAGEWFLRGRSKRRR